MLGKFERAGPRTANSSNNSEFNRISETPDGWMSTRFEGVNLAEDFDNGAS